MLNKQELINKSLELADKGAFDRKNIKSLIKEDFNRQIAENGHLLKLYDKLAAKYGYSRVAIMKIING